MKYHHRVLIGTVICLITSASLKLSAKVLSSAANGFEIRIEGIAHTDPATAYQQFVQVGEWWNSEHTWFGKSADLSIDARAGGCFCEKDGKRQVLHMTVSYVDPNKEIRLVGGLGPLQMLGVHGGMSWQFESMGNNKTRIIQTYHLTGYMKEGLDKLAPIVDQVQTIQLNGLVKKLNQKK